MTKVKKGMIKIAMLEMWEEEDDREIIMRVAIAKSDLEAWKNIGRNYPPDARNVFTGATEMFPESIWCENGGEYRIVEELAGGGVGGWDHHPIPDRVVISAEIPAYSNYLRAFEEATGVLLDARFL